MTLINIFSAASYLKDASLREKIQVFALPVIFLALLYNSPSGLVIYWICNNLFSLAKNLVKRGKQPRKTLYFIVIALLAAFCALFWIFKPNASLTKKLLLSLTVITVAFMPKAVSFITEKTKGRMKEQKENFALFIASAAGLSLLLGLVLPCSVISSDPIAFSFLGSTESPFAYIKTSFFTYTGVFVVWGLLIYRLFSAKVRIAETKILAVLFFIALCNSFIFKYDYGTINILFNIEEEILQAAYPLLNALSLLSFASICILVAAFSRRSIVASLSLIICLAEIALSVHDAHIIRTEFQAFKANIATKTKDDINGEIESVYHLSKTGKNVVVIFIDKAVGAFFPILQKEHPEIADGFLGFTFYPNTASFGSATLYGSPAMLGGYDYTPERNNARADVLLRQKHNEATLMMPRLFMDNEFSVTVTDPPLPNFTEAGDLSAFAPYPAMNAKELKNVYTARYKDEVSSDTSFDGICEKGVVNFSMLQVLMPCFRNSFYRVMKNMDSDADDFFASFPSLYYMRNLTAFDASGNTFTFIGNETPHFVTYLNTENFTEVSFEKDTSSLLLDTDDKELIMNYHSFIAALKQLSLWCAYLRENDCYDNTRIIIVSDHGHENNIPNDFNDEKKFKNPQILSFNPILLCKDFDSRLPLRTDFTFMTNADTVFLATENLISHPKNPFLGTPLRQEKSNGLRVYHTAKGEHNPMPIQNNKILHLTSGFFIPTDLFHVDEWEEIKQ